MIYRILQGDVVIGYAEANSVTAAYQIARRYYGTGNPSLAVQLAPSDNPWQFNPNYPLLTVVPSGHLFNKNTGHVVPDLLDYNVAQYAGLQTLVDGQSYWLGACYGRFDRVQNIFHVGNAWVHKDDTIYVGAQVQA